MKFWKFGLAACLLVLAGYLGWRLMYPSYEWRQKITVEVETPQGPVSASSVAEIAWWGVPKILPDATPRDWSVRAEAVVVPLPDGRYLFALVKTAEVIARAVFFDPLPKGRDPYLYPASQMKQFRGEVHDIQPENYPLLVTFDDIDDPTTVKRVDPDDLAASFGPGASLKRITLEITDEPVTEGEVEKLLGWLEEVGRERGSLIPNPPRLSTDLTDPDIQLLGPSAFSTELYK
jgi:hypothetical protein